MNGLGARTCVRWTAWYTRGLPLEISQSRRDEVASDLWEHGRDAAAAGRGWLHYDLDVLGRVLSGIPADLTWRQGILRSHPRPAKGDLMASHRRTTVAFVATVVLAAIGIQGGLAALIVLGTGAANGDLTGRGILWTALCVTLAACLVVGLLGRDRHPGRSTTLLIIGSPVIAIAWFWLPPAYLLTIGLVVATLVSRPRPASAPTAS